MNKLKNIVWHFNTIRQHRKWVRYYCFKAGLYKQSLLHDLSKYTPTEFLRIRKILYGYKFTYRYVQKRTRVFDGLATP